MSTLLAKELQEEEEEEVEELTGHGTIRVENGGELAAWVPG